MPVIIDTTLASSNPRAFTEQVAREALRVVNELEQNNAQKTAQAFAKIDSNLSLSEVQKNEAKQNYFDMHQVGADDKQIAIRDAFKDVITPEDETAQSCLEQLLKETITIYGDVSNAAMNATMKTKSPDPTKRQAQEADAARLVTASGAANAVMLAVGAMLPVTVAEHVMNDSKSTPVSLDTAIALDRALIAEKNIEANARVFTKMYGASEKQTAAPTQQQPTSWDTMTFSDIYQRASKSVSYLLGYGSGEENKKDDEKKGPKPK